MLHCVSCLDDYGESQRINYVPEEQRFVHKHINRDCYRDSRERGRAHGFLQQMILKTVRNSPAYGESELEYSLRRPGTKGQFTYDVRADLPSSARMAGVLIEVQHASGNFNQRLKGRVEIAHHYEYGYAVVFSSYRRGAKVFLRRLAQIKQDDVALGVFSGGRPHLGSVIRPGDDLTPLRP